MCCNRDSWHGKSAPMLTFVVGTIHDEHRSIIFVLQTESTLVRRFFSYRAHMKAFSCLTTSLETIQLSPNLERGPENCTAFCITLIGFTFPIPLKQLIASHPVYACSAISVVQCSGPNSIARSPMSLHIACACFE